MRKVTEGLIVVAFLLCAFTSQAATGIDVSVPSAGEPCSNTLDCGDNEECILDVCVSTITTCVSDADCGSGFLCKALETNLCIDGEIPPSAPIDNTCTSDADCEAGTCQEVKVCTFGCSSDADCDDGLLCNDSGACVECLTNADCDDGLLCDNNTSFMCVECLTRNDCDIETEICADNNTCVLADDCDLRIRPKRIKIKKNQRVTWRTFKLSVKGNENFSNPVVLNSDGTNTLDYELSPVFETGKSSRWFPKRRLFELVASVFTDEESGTYTLRFGKCLVDFEIENNNILIKK